jgi:uncharacterized protein YraI
VTASDGNTNVRTGPGTEYPKDGLLLEGGTLEIIGRTADSTWWQVATADGPRWIAAEVTTASNVTDAIPIVGEGAVAAVPTETPIPPTATPKPMSTATPEPVVAEAETAEVDEAAADAVNEETSEAETTETVNQPEAGEEPVADTAAESETAEADAAEADSAETGDSTTARTAAEVAETCRAISILAPVVGQVTNNPGLEIRWQCDGSLAENYGFEVRLWRPGSTPIGAHDAINDQVNINHDGNTYSLIIPIEGTSGFDGKNKEYLVAVAVVQIAPVYQDLGVTSNSVEFLFE